MNKQELKYLLQKYNIHPRKEQSQNFLIDSEAVHSSVAAAELSADDIILEIGPGFGVLTTQLLQNAKTVIAVEQDRSLFPALKALQTQYPNLQLVNEDIRSFNLTEAGLEHLNYKVISNLPYNIASWALRNFLEHEPAPSHLVVMVQQEVAERVTAAPGQMSVLSAAVQCFADASIVRFVDRTSFFPEPSVDSAILKIIRKPEPILKDTTGLLRLIKIGFSAKRKQLHKNLHAGIGLGSSEVKHILEQVGVRTDVRAQELSIEQWRDLFVNIQGKF